MTPAIRRLGPIAILAMFSSAGGHALPASSPPERQPDVPSVRMDRPPDLPKVDLDACPFEGCQFGDWRARRPAVVYSSWRAGRSRTGTIHAGDHVTALTGVNMVRRPGRVIFTRDVPGLGVKTGDIAYTYKYCGEGATDFWANGRFFSCTDLNLSTPDGFGCHAGCDGRYAAPQQAEWWANVEMKDGRKGWVLVGNRFDGTDALAGGSRR